MRRLRWQLTLSHLIAIAVTLVAMVAAVVLLTGRWLSTQFEPGREPAQLARQAAAIVDETVRRSAPSDELASLLRVLASGDLTLLPSGPLGLGPPLGWRGERSQAPSVLPVYLAVVAPDGRLLASSATGQAVAPAERAAWDELRRAALAGEQDTRRLTRTGVGPTGLSLGAAAIVDEQSRPLAVVLAATGGGAPTGQSPGLGRLLVIVWAASLAVLSGAAIFALAAASLVAYLLSRRLVARLERLGQTAEALAAGELSQRVMVGPADELGQLERRLNGMADRLAATMSELATQKARAETALQARRALVATVSHELRTPLTLIRGHLESLQMRQPMTGAGTGDDLTIIQRETERLERLIDDLFALSTAEAGTLALTLETVDLAAVIAEVVASIQPIAQRERQVMVLAATGDPLPAVRADRGRVVQVLGNLVRNALRYTPEGGLIQVQAARAERPDLVRVSVEDTGIGIAPEVLPHIFERFYRGDAARDRAGGGAGLGLAIVRELVEAMGGTVAASSTPGQGSRLSFTLPLAATRPDPAADGR